MLSGDLRSHWCVHGFGGCYSSAEKYAVETISAKGTVLRWSQYMWKTQQSSL